jgi:hypothetical protein
LKQTVQNVLGFADNYGCNSVALPAISSGIFDFPKRLCAKEMFDAIEQFAEDRTDFSTKCDYLERVEIIIIDELTFGIFKDEFDWRYVKKFGPKDKYYYLYESHYPKSSNYDTTYKSSYGSHSG